MVADGVELCVGARREISAWDGVDRGHQVVVCSSFAREHHHLLDFFLVLDSLSVGGVVCTHLFQDLRRLDQGEQGGAVMGLLV